MKRRISRTVVAAGVVSFLTDVSAEMIYPLLPAFLATEFGAGAFALGLIEGVAESTAAILKLVSGVWSDRIRKKKPFVLIGYGLSGAARPLIGLATSWPGVLAIRLLDRVGKGIRTSPRDALISDSVDESMWGRSFGLQRAMDHAGSVVGPMVASALLLLPFMEMRQVFLLAAIPSVFAFLAVFFFVEEKNPVALSPADRQPLFKLDWSVLTPEFKRLLIALFVFSLGLSTDAFLLLRLNEVGVSAGWIAFLWALHGVVKMAATSIGGVLSDRFGDRKLMISSWIFYSVIYLVFSLDLGRGTFVAIFLLYGIYHGLSEPSERSFVSKTASGAQRGTAFGFFHLMTGLAALPASVLFGVIWQSWGSARAFQFGSGLAVVACLILISVRKTTSVRE